MRHPNLRPHVSCIGLVFHVVAAVGFVRKSEAMLLIEAYCIRILLKHPKFQALRIIVEDLFQKRAADAFSLMIWMHIEMINLFVLPGDESRNLSVHFADRHRRGGQDMVREQREDFFERVIPVEKRQVGSARSDEDSGDLGGIFWLGRANGHTSNYSAVR